MRVIVVGKKDRTANIVAMLEARGAEIVLETTYSGQAIATLGNISINPANQTDLVIYPAISKPTLADFIQVAKRSQPKVKVFAYGIKWPDLPEPFHKDHGADEYLNEPFGAGDLWEAIEKRIPTPAAT